MKPSRLPAPAAPRFKSVSSGLVRRIQRRLSSAGIERREFCERTGVTEHELDSDSARIGARRYAAVQLLLRQCLNEGLPMERPSMSTLLDDLPRLASLWCNSPSLATAIDHYGEYRALLGEFDSLHVHLDAHSLELHYLPDSQAADNAFGADSALGNFMLIASIIDHYGRDSAIGATVTLGGMPPAALPGIEYSLGPACRIAGRDGEHRMVLRGEGLWCPATGFNPLLYAHSRRALSNELQGLHRLPPLAARVRAAIERLWSQGPEPGGPHGLLLSVAEQLHMSRWTLRRHLEEEGLGFTGLLDDLRVRAVRALLEDPALSMLEISQRLGFDSQSSFSRFFRKHFDQTPAQAREHLRTQALAEHATISA